MNRENFTKAVNKTSGPNFWKLGLMAVTLLLCFTLFSPILRSKMVPSSNTFAEGEKSVIVTSPTGFSEIKIKNFGQMDENFYRGAQPKPEDYKSLAKLGIKTVIDLRDDPKSYEKPGAEAAGLNYVNVPMDDKSQPKEEQVTAFLAVTNDSNNWPFYVHCAGGRHRTGLAGAVYRFNKYGWSYDQVYKEMKNYDFYSAWGHEPIKDYVYSYYQKIKVAKPFTFADLNGPLPPTQPLTEPPPQKTNE